MKMIHHPQRRGRKSAALLAALLLVGTQFAAGETYQYIISGSPADNESYSAVSSAISIEVATTRHDESAASPMEARYRTWDESDGIPLRSDKFKAMMIIFR